MSGTTEGLQKKISGSEDLQSVVRSMKALAASSIGQYESSVASLDDYYRTVKLGLVACLRDGQSKTLPVDQRSANWKGVGAIVFGSDQGLVGSFNEAVVDLFSNSKGSFPGTVQSVWAIGERAQGLLLASGMTEVKSMQVPASVDAITSLVSQILIQVENAREKGDLWEVYLFHNRPKSGSLYEPVCKRLVPLDKAWTDKLLTMPWPSKVLPEVIDDLNTVFSALVRGYLFVVLFQACAESLASENASRLAAMERAEKNIEGILAQLTQTLRRVRQAAIDEELFDLISGFDALNGKRTHV